MEAQQEIKKEPEENNSYEESNTSESEDDSDLESIQRFTQYYKACSNLYEQNLSSEECEV